jgi:hypothetical protein
VLTRATARRATIEERERPTISFARFYLIV